MNVMRYFQSAKALGALLGSVALSASAQMTLTARSARVTVGEEVEFTINSALPASYCGIRVSYGGTAESETLIRINKDGSTFPHVFRKAFRTPGEVTVVARGAKVSSALGCVGEETAKVTVVGAAATAFAAPSPDLRALATAGDPEAMYALGNRLANSGDDVAAIKWFIAAAQKSHARAMNSLGFMYEEGRGALQDHAEAAIWYGRATALGNADAMVNRGLLMLKGLGVTRSLKDAYIHFSLATLYAKDAQLRSEATRLRNDAARELSSEELTTSQAEAKKLASQIKLD